MKTAQALLVEKLSQEAAAKGGDASAASPDCLKSAAPGPETLDNPEPQFFVVGMKSYGKFGTNFIMKNGYAQVDMVVEKSVGEFFGGV